MESKDIIVVTAALLSAAVTIGVPVINHFLSQRKYAADKLWDLRREAYSKIIAALSEAGSYFKIARATHESAMRDLLEGKGWATYSLASNSVRENYVVCSNEFLTLYDEVRQAEDLLLPPSFQEPQEMVEFAKTVEGIRERLLKQARRELRI